MINLETEKMAEANENVERNSDPQGRNEAVVMCNGWRVSLQQYPVDETGAPKNIDIREETIPVLHFCENEKEIILMFGEKDGDEDYNEYSIGLLEAIKYLYSHHSEKEKTKITGILLKAIAEAST